MWVNVDAKAVLFALADEGDDIVEVILVVFPAAGHSLASAGAD